MRFHFDFLLEESVCSFVFGAIQTCFNSRKYKFFFILLHNFSSFFSIKINVICTNIQRAQQQTEKTIFVVYSKAIVCWFSHSQYPSNNNNKALDECATRETNCHPQSSPQDEWIGRQEENEMSTLELLFLRKFQIKLFRWNDAECVFIRFFNNRFLTKATLTMPPTVVMGESLGLRQTKRIKEILYTWRQTEIRFEKQQRDKIWINQNQTIKYENEIKKTSG